MTSVKTQWQNSLITRCLWVGGILCPCHHISSNEVIHHIWIQHCKHWGLRFQNSRTWLSCLSPLVLSFQQRFLWQADNNAKSSLKRIRWQLFLVSLYVQSIMLSLKNLFTVIPGDIYVECDLLFERQPSHVFIFFFFYEAPKLKCIVALKKLLLNLFVVRVLSRKRNRIFQRIHIF